MWPAVTGPVVDAGCDKVVSVTTVAGWSVADGVEGDCVPPAGCCVLDGCWGAGDSPVGDALSGAGVEARARYLTFNSVGLGIVPLSCSPGTGSIFQAPSVAPLPRSGTVNFAVAPAGQRWTSSYGIASPL